jgi:YVTN family beta-propeller protein
MRVRWTSRSRPLPAAITVWSAALAISMAIVAPACSGPEKRSGTEARGAGAHGTTPGNSTVFVSNETQDTVVMLDGATGAVHGRIPVGKRPRGIKVSRDGSRLFVALSGSPIAGPGVDESKLPPADRAADGIGVIDLQRRTLVRIYPSGQDPESFDLSPDGRTLYVSNEETAEMSALDLERGTITGRVHVCGEPEGVTVSPDGRVVYVTCEADNAVAVVDTRSLRVTARIPTAARPRSIAVTADGRTLFITCENAASISVADATAREARSAIQLTMPDMTATPPRPMGAVLSPDGSTLFVSNGRAQSISAIDVATRLPSRVIQGVGARPWGIALSPDGRRLYTANGPSGDVSFVDVAAGTVERRVRVGGSPWGVAVRPAIP